MTRDEQIEGAALLSDVVKILSTASFKNDNELVRAAITLERLAKFFGTQLNMEPI